MSADEGGDPPCWAHLFDEEACAGASIGAGPATAADLGSIDTRGRSGVVWSLPHGGDLDANLVHLDAAAAIGSHVNDEVDVMISVIGGGGGLLIDDTLVELRSDVVVLIPKGSRRVVRAGDNGLTYLSVHRRRGPLATSPNPKGDDEA